MVPPRVQAHKYVALRLASGVHRILKICPDTDISLGKHGAFAANAIIGKPFYLTYELLDKPAKEASTSLRVVPAAELHAEALSGDAPNSSETLDDSKEDSESEATDDVQKYGQSQARDNRLTVDDASRQALTWDEIEELKRTGTGSGKDIIEKIMKSHSAISEKTAFSLAKYTLRKSKKYLRRFTVLPLDVGLLAHWLLHEKDASRIMELREETLGLMMSWSNVHSHGDVDVNANPGGRYLVVDDTGGLIVAAMADRMGLLETEQCSSQQQSSDTAGTADQLRVPYRENLAGEDIPGSPLASRPKRDFTSLTPASSNVITLVHSANQPNTSLLEYFDFDSNDPHPDHPLYRHLHTLNLLQLLRPDLSALYSEEPPVISNEELSMMKSAKRGTYHRKRRRWERTRQIVDETRQGGFDALIIASHMDLVDLIRPLIPLVRGGGQVVVYSPNVEPLAKLCDVYSSARRSAFINTLLEGEKGPAELLGEDFPVDPRLLLPPSLQTVRARLWQVLPGRTHPVMTSRGGPEGYIFAATRVHPTEDRVAARGNFSKAKKPSQPSPATIPTIKRRASAEIEPAPPSQQPRYDSFVEDSAASSAVQERGV